MNFFHNFLYKIQKLFDRKFRFALTSFVYSELKLDREVAKMGMNLVSRDVVTNYYTGEKWFLVSVEGGEKYISETKYLELNSEAIKLTPKFSA